MTEGYKIISNLDARGYLEAHNIEPQGWSWDLTIANRSCLGYYIPNDEILLFSQNRSPDDNDYPCFLFKDFAAFDKMRKENYFPIPDSFKTAYEIEDKYLRSWDVEHFKNVVNSHLNGNEKISLYHLNPETLKTAYKVLFRYVKGKQNPIVEKDRFVISFGVLAIDYFKLQHSGSVYFYESYEGFNPIVMPELLIKGKNRVLIMDYLFSSFEFEKDGNKGWQQFYSTSEVWIREKMKLQ